METFQVFVGGRYITGLEGSQECLGSSPNLLMSWAVPTGPFHKNLPFHALRHSMGLQAVVLREELLKVMATPSSTVFIASGTGLPGWVDYRRLQPGVGMCGFPSKKTKGHPQIPYA